MQPQEVIELIKVRDESGIQALLTHFGPLLRYVIAPILADDADREECLSECAMRVWDSIDSFDERRGSWTAWLTAIARNAALNRARARFSAAFLAMAVSHAVQLPRRSSKLSMLSHTRMAHSERHSSRSASSASMGAMT